ncbi:MAG: substrate-binding periplasmic protein [Dongiaceae bacterium]
MKNYVMPALIAVIVSLLVYNFLPRSASDVAAKKETAFERVMRTGVLRCGYYVFPPVTKRDPNTNELSGFAVDLMERISKITSLKIEWAEEIGFGNWTVGLQNGRFDAICTPLWPDGGKAREAFFTRPLFYSAAAAYVRFDDHRFDNDLSKLNDPNVTMVIMDGNVLNALIEEYFPKVKTFSLPANTDYGTLVQNVTTGKADVVLADLNGAMELMRHNPNSIRNPDPTRPIKLMPFEIAVARGEVELQQLLDVAVQDQLNLGVVDRLLTKWEQFPGSFYRVAQPFRPTGQ